MYAVLLSLGLIALVPPTNMELVEEALVLSSALLPDTLLARDVPIVTIEIEGEHAGGWLVRQTLTAVLSGAGITVLNRGEDNINRRAPDDMRPPGNDYTDGTEDVEQMLEAHAPVPVLRVRPMELVVEYGKVDRPWIVGARRVERIARCELSITLIDYNEQVIMTMRVGETVRDRVSWSDAKPLMGSPEWEWLSSDLPEGAGGGLLEPLVVSGVVASLIYLFYSSRAE